MDDKVFINKAFNDGIKLYLDNKDKLESLEYNSFLCCVIRILVLIYDESSIINYYNTLDEDHFNTLMIKYGFSVSDYSEFVNNFGKYYHFLKKQENKAIKKKNKYFNLVQKSLIDMLVKRNSTEKLDETVINEIYDLLFTANSKDFYRKSVALVQAYNPYEIDDYFKKQNLLVG